MPRDPKQKSIDSHALRPESLMMSYGFDPRLSEGALKCPIFQNSTFVFESAEAGKAFFELAYGLREAGPGEEPGLIYSRLNNPDLEILEDRLTLWDEAEAAITFESGMAAIATSLLAYCRPGDVLIHSEPLYGGSEYLVTNVLPEFGIDTIGFQAGIPAAELAPVLTEKVGGRPVRAALIETPANPTNDIVDIQGMSDLIHGMTGGGDQRPVVMVDNTFLGPLWQHPLDHGADMVLYSATKFIGGHSDLIAGACLGSTETLHPIRVLRTFMGTMTGPWTGWLLMRSLETLKMRMTAAMKNARYVADFLDDHPKVTSVHYLGLIRENDPMFEVYRHQCVGPGSLIAFEVKDGEAGAFRFLNALQLVKLAVSLGGTESLAEHPGTMTHADVPPDDQARMGLSPSMVRLSVGVEHYSDILADLEQALEAV
ncbi:MAG: cystathionine gamma-synthase family protein [Gemmatimonadales bacterium]|nr:cystathionine gamma-synthase family protein [Gemmatimonadales bacterium]